MDLLSADILLLVVCALVALAFVLCYRLKPVKIKRTAPVRTLVVMGSGGHTMEMNRLLDTVDPGTWSPMHIIVAEGDDLSTRRMTTTINRDVVVHRILRSRRVGQSYVTSIWTTIVALIQSVILMLRIYPELVLINGPGTCVPVAIASKLVCRSTVVFVESFCRVKSLSLSGRILYFIADYFVVQWPYIVDKYPRARYLGNILV